MQKPGTAICLTAGKGLEYTMEKETALHGGKEPGMYCCNCGKELGDEDRFCDHCGTPVYEDAGTETGDLEERKEVPEEEKTVVLGEGQEPVDADESGQGAESLPAGEGAALSDLEKKIMKNMEDELILTMPETAGPGGMPYGSGQPGQPSYGGGQIPPHYVPGGQETGPGGQPPYGQGEKSAHGRGEEPAKKKKKRALIITLACVVAALAVTVVILVFLLFSPENKLKKCVEDRDWSAAADLYEEHFQGNEKKEAKADEILRKAVDALREEFVAGTMDYSTVKRHLKGIEDFWDDDYVEEALDYVRELSDSRDAFEEAEECMGREEYEDAVRLYGEVAKSDPNYGIAQEKLDTARASYKNRLLEEAQAYAEIKDYDSAIELVEKGLEILTGDAELDSRLDELRGEKEQYGIDSVLAKAADYASQNNYYEALEAVREGLLENAGNDRLEAALKDYSEKYKKDILARAEEAIGTDENYEAAILVFDSALNTLDGDYAQIEQAIREKREEYIQLQLEKSQRENAESAIVGTWHGVAVSSGGIDIPMDQFLEVGGMPGAAVMLGCQPSGSFHIDMFGEVGDGTWRRDEAGNGVYYLDVEGAVQQVQVDTSGRLHMDFNGVSVIFEKTEGA